MRTLLKIALGLLVGLGVIVVGVAAITIATGSSTVEEEETAEVTTEEEAEEPMDDRYTIERDGGDVVVEFEIAENFSAGLTASGGREDVLRGIRAADEAHDNYARVRVIARYTDGGFENPVADAYYEAETVEEMRPFNPEDSDKVFEKMDYGTVHPDFRG